jgi:hypothetical protein
MSESDMFLESLKFFISETFVDSISFNESTRIRETSSRGASSGFSKSATWPEEPVIDVTQQELVGQTSNCAFSQSELFDQTREWTATDSFSVSDTFVEISIEENLTDGDFVSGIPWESDASKDRTETSMSASPVSQEASEGKSSAIYFVGFGVLILVGCVFEGYAWVLQHRVQEKRETG